MSGSLPNGNGKRNGISGIGPSTTLDGHSIDDAVLVVQHYVLQYFGQNSGRPVSDGAIVTKVLVIGAGFFQALPLG